MTKTKKHYNIEPRLVDENSGNGNQKNEEYLGTTRCIYRDKSRADFGLIKCNFEEINGTSPDCGGHCRDFGGQKYCEGKLKRFKKTIIDINNQQGLEGKTRAG